MFRILDILLFTLERLRLHQVLVFWVLVGLSAATTLALSLVLYVDAVNTNLLSSQLDDPPYAFRFRYVGSWEGNITEADYNSADASIERDFINPIGLPIGSSMSLALSTPWRVQLDMEDRNFAVGPYNLGTVQGIEDKIRITAGAWPPGEDVEDDQPATLPVADTPQPPIEERTIPVLLSETMLFDMGLQVGDMLSATQAGLPELTLEVAAFWQPINPDDPRWIFVPSFFEDVMMISEASLWDALEGSERPSIEEAGWYIVFDGSEVRTADIGAMLGDIANGERDVARVLPGVRMSDETATGLNAFTEDVNALTQQLVIIILPVAGLMLYFVSLVAGLLVSRQQQEDVILRSRGMNRRMLISIYVLMWLLLAGGALLIGLLASPFVVQIVGRTTSFLEFQGTDDPLEIVFTVEALAVGAFTAMLAASSGLFMAWRSTGQTITGFKRQSARASRAWWQRMYLDVLLLIPGVYVLFNLSGEGGLATDAEDPFADPLTFVGPTLFALGMTLLFLRVWPFLMRIGAGIISYTRNIALLMALRELTRSIGRYRGTLLMMCFTLSLVGLTASMASTIDRSLRDSVNYRIGADTVVVTAVDTQAEQNETDDGQQTFTVTGFNVLPADDVLDVEGVLNVSRVGKYPARLLLRSSRAEGTIVGVDRATMATVTRSREDYADMPFADMFNLLATNRAGVLVNRQVMTENNLLIGQEIDIQVSVLGEWVDTSVPILGVVDYFPTLDPRENFFMIGNIEPIFELAGTPLPHDLWLGLTDGLDSQRVRDDVRELGFPILQWRDPQTELQEALAQPSRRGVLGFLSVGFIASIVLTLVATIIQNTVSFRAQAVQLGSMRAMGMRGISSTLYLILLQGIAAVSGILGGTVIGVLTTQLFLPLLDFSGGLPPYLVRVAWDEIIIVYGLFAGVLFAVTLMTTIVASFQQLSNVVKLGDV
jgi:putative ABC transport system permease protein